MLMEQLAMASLSLHDALGALGAVLPAADEFGFGAEEGGSWLWLLGPVGGIGFYMLIFLRYRNTDKRHAFERETATEMLDLRTYDQKTGEVKGVENSSIPGRNSNTPLKRLGTGTTVTEVPPPEPPQAPQQSEVPPQSDQPQV